MHKFVIRILRFLVETPKPYYWGYTIRLFFLSIHGLIVNGNSHFNSTISLTLNIRLEYTFSFCVNYGKLRRSNL